jgi:hypothetical protein
MLRDRADHVRHEAAPVLTPSQMKAVLAYNQRHGTDPWRGTVLPRIMESTYGRH